MVQLLLEYTFQDEVNLLLCDINSKTLLLHCWPMHTTENFSHKAVSLDYIWWTAISLNVEG